MPEQKREALTRFQRGVTWVCGMLIVMSIGVMFYLGQIVRLRQEHEFSSFLIKTASQQGMVICRGFAEIELQHERLEVAKVLGDRDLIDAYTRQIENRHTTILNQWSDYKEIILKLGSFKEKTVNMEFERYAQALIQEKAFFKLQSARLAALNYQLLTKNKNPGNIEAMHQACKENLVTD